MRPIVVRLSLAVLLATRGSGNNFRTTLAPFATTKRPTSFPDRAPLVSVLCNEMVTFKCLRTDISKYAGSRVLAL